MAKRQTRRCNHNPDRPWTRFHDRAKRIESWKMTQKMKRRHAIGDHRRDWLRDPYKYSRLFVRNGSTRKKDEKLWVKAEKKASEFMTILEQEGVVPIDEVIVPESDEALAKAAIKEAAKFALGPIARKDKLVALKMVLDFTKAKPVSKSEISVSGPEEWLKNAIAENERPRRTSERSSGEVQD